jgi:hypothetical protein
LGQLGDKFDTYLFLSKKTFPNNYYQSDDHVETESSSFSPVDVNMMSNMSVLSNSSPKERERERERDGRRKKLSISKSTKILFPYQRPMRENFSQTNFPGEK